MGNPQGAAMENRIALIEKRRHSGSTRGAMSNLPRGPQQEAAWLAEGRRGSWRNSADASVDCRFIQAGGVRVRVLQQGTGEPVLFVHGVGGWAEHWQGVLPSVARAGFRAIACDLPGFGLSAPPRQVRYL